MAAHTPQGDPAKIADDLALDPGRLGEILDDPARRRSVEVRLSIHGGVEDERFDLDLRAAGDGAIECSLNDAVLGRRVERTKLRMREGRMAEIVRTLEPLALSRMVLRTGGFPPCSLIGRLEVALGDRVTTAYFMADPEQARTAGFEPPPGVTQAVEMLYDEAEQSLGVRVRP